MPNEELRQKPGMSVGDIKLYLMANGRPIESAEMLMSAHGLDESASPNEIVSIDTCWRLFSEHAVLVGDEMHNVTKHNLRPGTTGLIIARMLLSDTVFGAIEAFCDASAVLMPDFEVSTSRRHDEVTLRWRFPDDPTEVQALALEASAVVYFAVICWLAEDRVRVLRARAPASRKESPSTLMQSFKAPVLYEGECVELVFQMEELEAPLVERNVKNWRDGVGNVLSELSWQSLDKSHEGEFTKKVRAELLKGLGQKQISAVWGMSTKTIARRLAQEGASFRQLRDQIRMHKAVSLIHANMSVEDVGYQVGYEDPRSFRRAFARWFGTSPSIYRSERTFQLAS